LYTSFALAVVTVCLNNTIVMTEKAKKIGSHQLVVVDDDDEINIKWAFIVVFRLLCLYLEFITTKLVELHYLG